MTLVLFERKEGILRVTLNRTSALNAINSALLQELKQGLKEYEKDETVRSLVLSGQGGCFASGADIGELASLDEEGIRRFHRLRETAFTLLENFHSPTIAVIEKYALGTGLELALCCDFRIASTDAKLGVPSAKLGLVESYEYFARLLRAVGPSWAKKMVFTGTPVDAETAWKIGLVEEIIPADKIFGCVDSFLLQMGKNSIASIRKTKKVMADCLKDPDLSHIADPASPLASST
ncbi:MAG: enoyl-CoA hydratase/isomerase family protein, partial [Deltaproteobacteria bacterium]|nr:enoyl-CoA hydratase/isomerase family protein [Deltaproteobacteria bacterium]